MQRHYRRNCRDRRAAVITVFAALGVLALAAPPASGQGSGQPAGQSSGQPAGQLQGSPGQNRTGHLSPPQASGSHMTGQPVALPADVASPAAAVAAYYEALSGPAGKRRDWNRFLSLFFTGARLLPAEGKGHSGVMPRAFTPEGYLFNTEQYMLESGYIEKEVARRVVTWGKIAHVLSTYTVVHAPGDAKPFTRGVNSFQLFTDGRRWWIFDVMWQSETAKLPLPDDLLK